MTFLPAPSREPSTNTLCYSDILTLLRDRAYFPDASVTIAEGHFPFSTGEVINVDGGQHLQRL